MTSFERSMSPSPILGFMERKNAFERAIISREQKYIRSDVHGRVPNGRITSLLKSPKDAQFALRTNAVEDRTRIINKTCHFRSRSQSSTSSYSEDSSPELSRNYSSHIVSKNDGVDDVPHSTVTVSNSEVLDFRDKSTDRHEETENVNAFTSKEQERKTSVDSDKDVDSSEVSQVSDVNSITDAPEQTEVSFSCSSTLERGRILNSRGSPTRSRSVGCELKNRPPYGKNYGNLDKNEMDCKKPNKSQWDLVGDSKSVSAEFKEKQKLIENVIKKTNCVNNNSVNKKSANVFRKLSFTSKLDKDMQNIIAKGRLFSSETNGKFNKCNEKNVQGSNKNKLFNIIPKMNGFGAPALESITHSTNRSKVNDRNTDQNINQKELISPEQVLTVSDKPIALDFGTQEIMCLPRRNILSESDLTPNKSSSCNNNCELNCSFPYSSCYADEPVSEKPRTTNVIENGLSTGPPIRPPRKRSPRKKILPHNRSNLNCVNETKSSELLEKYITSYQLQEATSDAIAINTENHCAPTLSELELPSGPPPPKPPRTFAQDAYLNSNDVRNNEVSVQKNTQRNKMTRLNRNSVATSSLPPVYAKPNKVKNRSISEKSSSSMSKPAIAPKPPHVRNLCHPRKFSLGDHLQPVDNSFNNFDGCASHELIRNVFPSQPKVAELNSLPPHIPTAPKPRLLSSSDIVDEEPHSLQDWPEKNTSFLFGALNKMKSQSDETLASSAGCQRIVRKIAEPIYATPDLRRAQKIASSGEELHYLCSDLLNRDQKQEFLSQRVEAVRRPAGRRKLLTGLKQELKDSCRFVQNRLKGSVNR